MHHNQTKEGLARHIRILKAFEVLNYTGFLGTRGEAARKISEITGIGEIRVYGTLHSHLGKIERFRRELVELGDQTLIDQLETLEESDESRIRGDTDQEIEVQVENIVSNERSHKEQIAIFHTLLEIIFEEGFDPSKEWSMRMQAKLGYLSSEEVAAYLSGLEDVGNPFIEKQYNTDGTFTYLVTETGEPYARFREIISIEVQDEKDGPKKDNHSMQVIESLQSEYSVKDLTDILSYIFTQKGIQVTPLDHKLVREKLGFTTEQFETNIGVLLEGGYLEIVGEKIVVSKDGEPYATGERKIELVNEDQNNDYGLVYEEEVSAPTTIKILDFIEKGPGLIRIMDISFVNLERCLGISPDERMQAIEELLRFGYIENNDRGAYVITSTGRKFLEDGGRQEGQEEGVGILIGE